MYYAVKIDRPTPATASLQANNNNSNNKFAPPLLLHSLRLRLGGCSLSLSLFLALARLMVCSLARFKYGDRFDWLAVRVGRVCSFARRAWELAQRGEQRRMSFECKMNATSAHENESERIQSNSNRLEWHRITLNYQLCSIKLTPASQQTQSYPPAASPKQFVHNKG